VNLGFLDAAVLCDVIACGIGEHEDPGAARLLTRPGEAIYNDANGLFERR